MGGCGRRGSSIGVGGPLTAIGPLRRMRRYIFPALLIFVGAGAAGAQNPTSSNDRITAPGIRRGDAARTDPVFRHVITCTVRREPTRSRNLVNSLPGTTAESMILGSYQSRLDQCYPRLMGGLGLTWDLLRGGIAELFYHHDFPAGLPLAPALPPGDAALAWTRPRLFEGRVTGAEIPHAIARCVVLRQPATVSSLLANAPFSAGEMAAMRSLQGDLAACLTAGTRFTASRQSLRGLLAEAALHYGEALGKGFRPDSPGDARGP
jgi:hypothetical protein